MVEYPGKRAGCFEILIGVRGGSGSGVKVRRLPPTMFAHTPDSVRSSVLPEKLHGAIEYMYAVDDSVSDSILGAKIFE